MSSLEEHMEGIVDVFHRYSVRVGNFDTLSKSEMKKLITRELANTIKNTHDQPTIDRIFQDLDDNEDGQVNFEEFVLLVARMLQTTHENLHQE